MILAHRELPRLGLWSVTVTSYADVLLVYSPGKKCTCRLVFLTKTTIRSELGFAERRNRSRSIYNVVCVGLC